MNFEKWFRESDDGYPKVYGYPHGDIYHPMKHSWEGCKEEILKILKKDWIGADLSINSCDKYYIDKIEKL